MSTNSISSLCSTISSYINSDGECNITAEKLTELFVDTDYYNAGETGQEQLQKQIDALEETIEKLVEEAEELNASINEKNYDVSDLSEQMADKISEITGDMTTYQKEVKKAAREAAEEATQAYKENNGKNSYSSYFESAFSLSGLSISAGEIQALYAEYEALKSSLSPLMEAIESDITEIELLQGKLNNTNATINLLTVTKNNMSDTIKNAYSNCDTDTNVPIYSGEKADIANSLLASYTSRYETEGEYTESTSTTATEAQEYLLSLKEGTYTSGDKYSVDTNPELANLRELYESDELQKLYDSGMSANEILTFISENWNVGITYDEESGTWSIPKGHSSDAWTNEGVYNYLAELVESGTTVETAEDVNQAQMTELAEFIANGELTNLYEAGFTFKEAMYLLTQLFPDAGITYNLDDQDGDRTYSIVNDSSASGDLYATIAAQILEYWNVGSTTATEESEEEEDTKRYDPITFTIGSSTYTFITDRDEDGTFDYTDGSTNELLGSENGIAELLAYDYNGDGVIDENDVDEDGNCALDQITLLVNNQIESIDSSEDVDNYKNGDDYTNSVDFDVTYTSARLAGITSIDVSGLSSDDTGTGDEITDTTKDYDNVTEAYDDINGSSVINSFTITINGETVTANETLNTESNLETFYKQIADNNTATIISSISDSEYDSAFSNWTNDAAEAAYDSLESTKENLEEQLAAAEDIKENYDDSEFKDSYNTFITKVSKDGYVSSIKQAAEEAAENNGGKKGDYESAGQAAEDAVEEYFESKLDDEEDNPNADPDVE